MKMKISQRGIDLIKSFEGLRLEAYLCPANRWTIGYGSTQFFGRPVNEHDLITIEEAEAQFDLDLIVFENIVANNIHVPLTQNQFDALVSHTYNTGGSETLFELINCNASPQEIRDWFENRYISANGVVINGLIKRRRTEAELFFNRTISIVG
jgi:lysozyme